MLISEILEAVSISLPSQWIEPLDRHRSQLAMLLPNECNIRFMELGEIQEMLTFTSQIEVFHDILLLWTDDESNYIGVFYKGPLSYRICAVRHEETDISPMFCDLSSFLMQWEQRPSAMWSEWRRDYPATLEYSVAEKQMQLDVECIIELQSRLQQMDIDDDLRCQWLYCIMALTPAQQLHTLYQYVQDEDMYVQERACEILGYHRDEQALEWLADVVRIGSPNGKTAAKQAIARIKGYIQ